MIELVTMGFAIVALFVPSLLLVTTLGGAKGEVETAAVDAAAWYARHGELPPITPDHVSVTVTITPEGVTVHASMEVAVVSIGGVEVTLPIANTAHAEVSPYRSDR
jgi:hypothetical protein